VAPSITVIASEAKQSSDGDRRHRIKQSGASCAARISVVTTNRSIGATLDCFASLAMTAERSQQEQIPGRHCSRGLQTAVVE
jgi:hypothetical protein